VQFRSVTCVGGRACVQNDKPAEDQTCNTGPCPSNEHNISSPVSASATEHPPARASAADDVTFSNDVELFDDVTTMASSVTIATVRAKTPLAVPQIRLTAKTATTTTATTTTLQTTVITRRPSTRYQWMALFWHQVVIRIMSQKVHKFTFEYLA